jgi:excisionase family DNA binding protein
VQGAADGPTGLGLDGGAQPLGLDGGPTDAGLQALGLDEAAQRLGVHYMTVYRYLRTGRLPAVKVAGEWRIAPEELDRLRHAQRAARPRGSRRTWATTRMVGRLLAGDEVGAWSIVEAALASGAAPGDIHLELLAPALAAIGDRWAVGAVSVGDEHRASVVARRLLSRLGPRFNRPGRKRGVVVVGAVAGERHEIPVEIVADQLRGARFEVVDLGADTPPESFVAAADQGAPWAVLLSVTGSGHERAVAQTMAALRARSAVHVLVGGAAVPDEHTAHALGSERWTGLDARRVVATVEELGAQPRRAAPERSAQPRRAAPERSAQPRRAAPEVRSGREAAAAMPASRGRSARR